MDGGELFHRSQCLGGFISKPLSLSIVSRRCIEINIFSFNCNNADEEYILCNCTHKKPAGVCGIAEQKVGLIGDDDDDHYDE